MIVISRDIIPPGSTVRFNCIQHDCKALLQANIDELTKYDEPQYDEVSYQYECPVCKKGGLISERLMTIVEDEQDV